MSDQALEHLQALGFSDYEGRTYVALLRAGPLTGYQLAKASGIPRPNVYGVLDRLQQRGAVVRIEVKGGAKYSALPWAEMLSGLSHEVEAHLEKAGYALSQVTAAAPSEHIWNVQGYERVMDRAEALVDGASEQLLVGLWAEESKRLSGAFARAMARNVVPTILCIQGCPEECGGCRGRVHRYSLAAGAKTRWLVLVADGKELLAGQVFPDGGAAAAITRLEVFVQVGTLYLQNTVAAAEIVRSLGPGLSQLVDTQALDALQGAGLTNAGVSWLEGILSAVGRRSS